MEYHNEWSASFNTLNRDKIHDIIAAFFCAYPDGEYSLGRVERFRLLFRRGLWVRAPNGELKPARAGQFRGADYNFYPIILRVLIQPTSDSLQITVVHEAVTPVPLHRKSRRLLGEMCHDEASTFEQYINKTIDTSNFPSGELKIETPTAETPKSDGKMNESPSGMSIAPNVTTPTVPVLPKRSIHPTSAARSRYPSAKKSLSTWWPASVGGTAALVALLVATFFAAFARTGEPIEGIAGAAINYFIVIIIRYFAVVQPMNR